MYKMTNGIALCKKCHIMVMGHEKEWESYFKFCWENKLLKEETACARPFES